MKTRRVTRKRSVKKSRTPMLVSDQQAGDTSDNQANRQRLHPKLQMVRNCDADVNQVRAELSASLFVPKPIASIPEMRGPDTIPQIAGFATATSKKEHWHPDNRSRINVFVDLDREDVAPLPGEKNRIGTLALAEVSVSELSDIAARKGVTMVNPAERLTFSRPAPGTVTASAPKRTLELPSGVEAASPVLIGIIDVQGFDFTHPDFLRVDNQKIRSRFVRIWDQSGTLRTPPKYKSPVSGKLRFDYGSEIMGRHIEAALVQEQAGRTAGKPYIPARELEPQSQMAPGSHGTHVASIAAGNSGVCPDAYIAGVLISLPEADQDRRKSFYDSSRIVDAVEYLTSTAAALGEELGLERPVPLSINISLGTNGDAHDGSSATCRWIQSMLALPGRCVSVAAGNAGQEAATAADDIGYVMGRIHTSGRIASRGLECRLEWQVIGNGLVDLSENELELWYSPQDRFAVWLQPPRSQRWIGPVDVRQYIENLQLEDGTFVSIYNEAYHPINGSNHIALYLTPNLTPGNVVGVDAGTWVVRLTGSEVRDGRFHGWIERDDPFRLGRVGPNDAWRFPSFFSERTNVDAAQISSLACAHWTIAVANFAETTSRIHISSSQGPTRDGRNKPDIAAAGTDIVAARGFSDDEKWLSLTGTSMASPFAAGVAARMLQIAPMLTAAQIGGIMQRTACPLPGVTYEWANDAGYGVIDPVACLQEAAVLSKRDDITSKFKNGASS
jgi:subtilisin family serine protease